MPTVHLIDYVAGNIRSLVNAIEKVGYTVEWIKTPEDVQRAEVSLLPPLLIHPEHTGWPRVALSWRHHCAPSHCGSAPGMRLLQLK